MYVTTFEGLEMAHLMSPTIQTPKGVDPAQYAATVTKKYRVASNRAMKRHNMYDRATHIVYDAR